MLFIRKKRHGTPATQNGEKGTQSCCCCVCAVYLFNMSDDNNHNRNNHNSSNNIFLLTSCLTWLGLMCVKKRKGFSLGLFVKVWCTCSFLYTPLENFKKIYFFSLKRSLWYSLLAPFYLCTSYNNNEDEVVRKVMLRVSEVSPHSQQSHNMKMSKKWISSLAATEEQRKVEKTPHLRRKKCLL